MTQWICRFKEACGPEMLRKLLTAAEANITLFIELFSNDIHQVLLAVESHCERNEQTSESHTDTGCCSLSR